MDYFLEFLKETMDEDYNAVVHQELSFKFDADKDNIMVRVNQGNMYRRGVVLPISILVTSKNILKAFEVWNNWVATISDKDYLEGTENYYMMFQTPYVTQVFDEISNNYYQVLSLFGTIVKTEGIDDIVKITIDGVEVELNEISLQQVGTVNMHQSSGDARQNKTSITSSVLTLQLTTFNADYGALSTKLKNIRTKVINPDTEFTVAIWKVGEQTAGETYTMKLTTQNVVKSRGAMSLLTLNFAV